MLFWLLWAAVGTNIAGGTVSSWNCLGVCLEVRPNSDNRIVQLDNLVPLTHGMVMHHRGE